MGRRDVPGGETGLIAYTESENENASQIRVHTLTYCRGL
jgi:hypothetical protein